MTIVFISLAALMLVAALAFVLPPLLRGRGGADQAASARHKLKALEQARADGILTVAEYAAKRAQIGEIMLSSIAVPATRSRLAFAAALAVALIVPAATIALYRSVGSPQALEPGVVAARAGGSPASHGPDMDAAIAKLAEKMQQNPNDAEGWMLLGRAYKATQRFAEARDALKHAHELAADDADIEVEYAEAMALSNPDHRVQGESRSLLDAALAADPQNQRGLWLLGIAESQSGNYDKAIADWNKLLALLPKGTDVAASIEKQIAQAQAMRDGKPLPADDDIAPAAGSAAAPPTGSTAGAAQDDGPHILVHVALDAKLAGNAAPGDTLFVFAKAAKGPPMPLAIARLTVAQLPATVTLTDGMGMLPTMKLSSFPQIVVGARISKSGQAIAQSGDLQALSAPMSNSGHDPVELTINQIVP